jgi:hypothetical protein
MYSILVDEEEKVKKFLKKNLAKGFIRESKSLIALLILFIRKPNRGLRLYVDY